MKQKYDVVLYFYWVHTHTVNKIIALHKELEKDHDVLTIFGNDSQGISKETFALFREFITEDIVLKNTQAALDLLRKVDFKIGVFSSNGRKGFRKDAPPNEDGTEPISLGAKWPDIGRDIKIAKDKGALSIQISEMINDNYYAGADIVSLISPSMRDYHIASGESSPYELFHISQWRPYDARPEPKYIYSNCLFWDSDEGVERYLPYQLTRKDFCEKYNLDEEKDILIYLPSDCRWGFTGKDEQTIGYTSGVAQEVYKKACSMDNVILKLHPKEYKNWMSYDVDEKRSYEILGIEDVRILEEVDTHWAYKYAACGISESSSVSIEFPLYKTPFLYVHPWRFPWAKLFISLSYVCGLGDFDSFIENKAYKEEISGLREFYNDTILADPTRSAVKILAEQIGGYLV